MRIRAIALVVMGTATTLPVQARVHSSLGVRHVELITMSGTTAIARDSDEEAATGSSTFSGKFRVHALSRRQVAFRMAEEFAATADPMPWLTPSAPAGMPDLVAPASSIAVPAWMRGTYAGSATFAYPPGCTPLSYRPTGFLGRRAEARRAVFYGMMSAIACEQGIPTGLLDAVIIRESGYNPLALSPKNAFGFAQLMPGTAASLGVNRYDPRENMRGGARYLRQQLDSFGQVHLALAAYNAGPGRVRHGLVPAIAETHAYVSDILANWSRLNSPSSPSPSRGVANAHAGRQAAMSSF